MEAFAIKSKHGLRLGTISATSADAWAKLFKHYLPGSPEIADDTCAPVQITEGWIPVGARLPDLVTTDDSPCRVGAEAIEPMSYSAEVLVEIEGSHGRRIDRLFSGVISEYSAWEIYGKRVTHWQPLPFGISAVLDTKALGASILGIKAVGLAAEDQFKKLMASIDAAREKAHAQQT